MRSRARFFVSLAPAKTQSSPTGIIVSRRTHGHRSGRKRAARRRPLPALRSLSAGGGAIRSGSLAGARHRAHVRTLPGPPNLPVKGQRGRGLLAVFDHGFHPACLHLPILLPAPPGGSVASPTTMRGVCGQVLTEKANIGARPGRCPDERRKPRDRSRLSARPGRTPPRTSACRTRPRPRPPAAA